MAERVRCGGDDRDVLGKSCVVHMLSCLIMKLVLYKALEFVSIQWYTKN